jgi:hypothetical protein
MSKPKRIRRVYSVSEELLKKSREAALAAVQIFNNPNITFKSETYTVLMNIAWTYLLHAYYRKNKIDYRYSSQVKGRRKFDRTKHGAFKHWELERCLNDDRCPLKREVSQNLRFLIGLRHEIEHQMTSRIDDLLSARFQACCINFNEAMVSLFGPAHGIAKHLAVSLQFASLEQEQVRTLQEQTGLPAHIRSFIAGFDGALEPEVFQSPLYAYRVIFLPKTANNPNQADQVITFIKGDSDLARELNARYAVIKEKEVVREVTKEVLTEVEPPKWLPSQIRDKMKGEGFKWFGMHQHTLLWKSRDAKDPEKRFGIKIASTWYWYDNWVDEVRKYCSTYSVSQQFEIGVSSEAPPQG